MADEKKKGRAKGTGYIFKIGDIYYVEYKQNGHRKKKSLKINHFRDRKKDDGTFVKGAETLVAEMLTAGQQMKTRQDIIIDIAQQKGIISADSMPLTDAFPEFAKIYRSERKVSDDTFLNYTRQWNRFESWLNSNYPHISELRDVTEDIAKKYWALFSDGAASTANQHLSTMKVVFDTLRDRAGLLSNPFDRIKRRTGDGVSREYITKPDMARLFKTFKGKGENAKCYPEYKRLFTIGKHTGLREADCIYLRWSEVQFDKNQIYLKPRKTIRLNRTATIPLSDEFRAELLKWRKEAQNEFVLPKIAADYTRYADGVKVHISDIFKRAGFQTTVMLPGRKLPTCVIGFHCFRGTLITDLFNAGVPASIISAIVADNISTLEKHYAKVNQSHIHEAIKKIMF